MTPNISEKNAIMYIPSNSFRITPSQPLSYGIIPTYSIDHVATFEKPLGFGGVTQTGSIDRLPLEFQLSNLFSLPSLARGDKPKDTEDIHTVPPPPEKYTSHTESLVSELDKRSGSEAGSLLEDISQKPPSLQEIPLLQEHHDEEKPRMMVMPSNEFKGKPSAQCANTAINGFQKEFTSNGTTKTIPNSSRFFIYDANNTMEYVPKNNSIRRVNTITEGIPRRSSVTAKDIRKTFSINFPNKITRCDVVKTSPRSFCANTTTKESSMHPIDNKNVNGIPETSLTSYADIITTTTIPRYIFEIRFVPCKNNAEGGIFYCAENRYLTPEGYQNGTHHNVTRQHTTTLKNPTDSNEEKKNLIQFESQIEALNHNKTDHLSNTSSEVKHCLSSEKNYQTKEPDYNNHRSSIKHSKSLPKLKQSKYSSNARLENKSESELLDEPIRKAKHKSPTLSSKRLQEESGWWRGMNCC